MTAPGRCLTAVGKAVANVFTAVPADASPPPARPAPPDGAFLARLNTELLQRRGRLAVAVLATVLGPAVVAQAGSIGDQRAADVRTEDPSGDPVPAPIPGDHASWLPVARQAAATCPGLSSAVLVAISSVESSLGLQTGTSSAGAVGPMQFLPSTWEAYGADGDGDGVNDVMNPVDAVHGAARLLCANGGADPHQLHSAVWNYNHSDEYVRQVIGLARFIPVGA